MKTIEQISKEMYDFISDLIEAGKIKESDCDWKGWLYTLYREGQKTEYKKATKKG